MTFSTKFPISAVLAAILAVAASPVGFASPAAAAEPESIQAVYVVATDTAPVADRSNNIASNIEAVNAWFSGQTDGRVLVFNRDGDGAITVPIVVLTETTAAIGATTAADADAKFKDQIEAAVPEAINSRLLIIYEGTVSIQACGYTSASLVIPTQNCGIYPDALSTFPYGITYLMAHELTHMLGAVKPCAPNYVPGSHVSGDNRDILYQQTASSPGRDWNNLMLDPGNDDYYNHGRNDCYDIANSPLLSGSPGPNAGSANPEPSQPTVPNPPGPSEPTGPNTPEPSEPTGPNTPASSGFDGVMSTATTIEELRSATTYRPAEHGDILRLYRAVFNREPDIGGALYWIDEIYERRQISFEEITTYIATPDQPEFAAAYANVASNEEFLTRVYNNMLGRIPDQVGFNYWLDLMDNAGLSRPAAVRWVSESQEFENRYPYPAVWR